MRLSTFVVNGREYKLGNKFLHGCDVAPRHLLRENIKQQKSLSRALLTRLGVLRDAAQPVIDYREQDQRKLKQLLSKAPSPERRSFDHSPGKKIPQPQLTSSESERPQPTE